MSQADVSAVLEPIPAKRRQILTGARQVFGELGYERASVDLIATRAGVSKATIYNHYEDKTALFVACVAYDAEEMESSLRACVGEPSADVEQALQVIGEKAMRLFLSPGVVALYRHIIAEATRLPHLGQTIYERGARVIQEAIASYLERWDRNGALTIAEPRAAALQFISLCQGDLVLRARLGILEQPVDDEVRETVRRAVRTFVRAYAP